MTLDSCDGTDTEAGPALSASEQEKVAYQLFDEISESCANIAKEPNPPDTVNNGDYSSQDQQQDVGGQPLARGSSTVVHDTTTAAQRSGMTLARCENINTEADSALTTDHPDRELNRSLTLRDDPLALTQRAAVKPKETNSTSIAEEKSPNPTSSITLPNQGRGVGDQQQKKGENSAADPRLICGKCKRVPRKSGVWTVHCSGCKDVWYCGSSCQRAAWKSHAAACKKTEQPQSPLLNISTEAPELGARYDPDDEFNTALMPLSENVPCMICEGTQDHQPGCMAAEFQFGPVPEYNEVMLEEIRRRVEYFDPEQWREHGHRDILDPIDPVGPPEEESARDAILGLNSIIRNESSYQEDAFLHGVPDEWLPIMWALRTSENVRMQLVTENGEIYDPNHPVWDENGDVSGAGATDVAGSGSRDKSG
ncbi:hypothetical protein P171DRAFT_483629 [Karstenula rhodostoma CBS 690.94]|uniref:MYND-type domain-containing protein n=1 Tax=Karstenula rhodostoma CBS 690.94 TaxID=1392251 RepID=A0A9P4UDF1_9PLEO|nr:hypothetical protein P171DRAFT_483629 [Karstenula rhodostoma CBS 690.94]